jgi:hypothetical protein
MDVVARTATCEARSGAPQARGHTEMRDRNARGGTPEIARRARPQ